MAYDQFGAAMATQPVIRWSVVGSGHGTITQKGVYTAPGKTGGPWTIVASYGGVKGTALVTVSNTALASPLLDTLNKPL